MHGVKHCWHGSSKGDERSVPASLQRLGVEVAAVDHGRRHPAVGQEAAQPLELLLVQDARHVLWLGEEPLQRRLEHLDLKMFVRQQLARLQMGLGG
jgi:hypothetical protein